MKKFMKTKAGVFAVWILRSLRCGCCWPLGLLWRTKKEAQPSSLRAAAPFLMIQLLRLSLKMLFFIGDQVKDQLQPFGALTHR